MVAGDAAQTQQPPAERAFPPITQLAVLSMALIVVGGTYIAAYVPQTVPLTLPIIVLLASVLVLLTDVVLLSRLQSFAWWRFFQVFRWTLLAYIVIAGMIGYVFVVDGTRGTLLLILIAMLTVFAVDIPLILGFSVARYEDT